MAEILYTCPCCPQQLRADEERLGGSVVCPRCGLSSYIPVALGETQCGRCRSRVKIPWAAAGDTFHCPKCDGEIRLAPLPAAPVATAATAEPVAASPATEAPMLLRVDDVSLEIGHQPIVRNVSLGLPGGHLAAIVGASGSGKTMLLKIIAGIVEPTAGTVDWQGRDLAVQDLAPAEIGYVPQFSIVYEHLTIGESMDTALRLRVAGLPAAARRNRALAILQQVGLRDIADRRVRVLSGGERRRLALALESVTLPSLLLCDEVTSGLDPKAEEEVVDLMRQLSRERNRLVISVTHSLQQLSRYDSVAMLHQGGLIYHGPSHLVASYFGVSDTAETFHELAQRPAAEWHDRWQQRRVEYPLSSDEMRWDSARDHNERDTGGVASAVSADSAGGSKPPTDALRTAHATPSSGTPGALTQTGVLLQRRARIFWRDRGQLWLHAALMFGFPFLVVIFALNGLPQMRRLSMGGDINPLQQLRETADYIIQSSRVGGLVSGLVMFQVILLALMGSNNAAREVAAERLIFEKEKLGGLRPLSYLASKAVFLAALVAAQSVWMAVFVNFICRFPGDLLLQGWLLLLGNAAITTVSLAISSLLRSPEQASLVSIYLVGFQIPLSGAFLVLPDVLGRLTRPFIAAYWSWAGVVETMRDTRFYDAVQMVTRTSLAVIPLCLWALASHVALGLLLAYIGCRRSRWE